MGTGYAPVRRGGDHPDMGDEKGKAVREIYDGMGRGVEGEVLETGI